MKISDHNNIKTLIIETLKNKSHQPLLEIGKVETKPLTPSAPSQLSQLIKTMDFYALLSQSTSSPPTILSSLLKNLVMPHQLDLAIRWLAEGQGDKSLANTLKYLSSTAGENEDNAKFKATLMLIAEQKTLENHKPEEPNWVFPLSEQNQRPVNVNIQKKQGKKPKKTCWCITINLTLSKNRQLTATANLEENILELSLSTDSAALARELKKTLPILEKQLSKHHILVTAPSINIIERTLSSKLKPGLNIQV